MHNISERMEMSSRDSFGRTGGSALALRAADLSAQPQPQPDLPALADVLARLRSTVDVAYLMPMPPASTTAVDSGRTRARRRLHPSSPRGSTTPLGSRSW